jgi:hypothetical protein
MMIGAVRRCPPKGLWQPMLANARRQPTLRATAAFLLAAGLAGCKAQVPDGVFACSADPDCPPSQRCRDGLCTRQAGAFDPIVGAGAGGAADEATAGDKAPNQPSGGSAAASGGRSRGASGMDAGRGGAATAGRAGTAAGGGGSTASGGRGGDASRAAGSGASGHAATNEAGTGGTTNADPCALKAASPISDQCCPLGANANTDPDCKPACGNGVVEAAETCDPPSTCPSECKTDNPCIVSLASGDSASCNMKCETKPVTECKNGDKCCPAGCAPSSDSDCSTSCGDGAVTGSETCETTSTTQPCPASCDDGKACTVDLKTGSSAQCNVVCTHMAITAPIANDGCCPASGNVLNDNDCKPVCGNGVKEGAELCDGADCPKNCDDRDPCTDDALSGTTAGCNVNCTHTMKTSSGTRSDGCCLLGGDNTNDVDCKVTCGNGVREGNETCDGDCRSSCDDGNACTTDVLTGTAAQCNVACNSANNTQLCVGGTCANAGGSYTCNCDTGYVGTGTQSCTKARYVTTADTVTDSTKNLVWQRQVPSSYDGCSAGMYCTWPEATRYCSMLTLAGVRGWRLPTLSELQTIVTGTGDPMVDATLFPSTPSDFYWSSETYDSDPMVPQAWCVNFVSGMSEVKAQGRNYHVRCVR